MLDILSAKGVCCDRYTHTHTHTVLSFEGNQIGVNKTTGDQIQ